MPVVAAVASVLAAGISAYSAIQQGNAQARMAALNAKIASQNASLALEQMEIARREKAIEEARHRRRMEKILAEQRAAWAKAGVEMAGTPLMVMADTMTESELDAMAIRYASTAEQSKILAQAAAHKQEALLQQMAGRQARTAGYLSAGSSLLSGLGSAYQFYSMRSK
jgi:DNA helicase IV